MQTLIKCRGCRRDYPHHAKGYCRNCYHKFEVRNTGEFDKNNSEVYKLHLSSIKEKISNTQKQKRTLSNSICAELSCEKLKELYCDQKKSMGDIARMYGCSRVYVLLLLKKYNLPIRNKSQARAEAKLLDKNVRYNAVDNDFFKKQTPEMVYVLGFIYSDGNVSNGLSQFSISQKEPEILIKIKNLMSSMHSIIKRKNQDLYTLSIGSQLMIKDLISLGLTPNKSLDAKFPILNKELYSHFMRGYFDGDGSIFLSHQGWKVSFVSGSKDFIYSLENKFHEDIGTRKQVIYNYQSRKNVFQIIYTRREDLVLIYKIFLLRSFIGKIFVFNKKIC